MDKLWILIALVFTGCESQLAFPGYPRFGRCPPTTGRFGACVEMCGVGGRLPRCPPGLLCCSNGCGHSCMRPLGPGGLPGTGVPPWCPPGSPRIQCFVNPCTVMRCPRFPWAICRPSNPCEPACSGAFYLWGRRLSDWECNSRRPIGK